MRRTKKHKSRRPARKKRVKAEPKSKRRRVRITRNKRHLVYVRDNFLCQLCGGAVLDQDERSLDHLIPVYKGGSDDKENLVLAHKACNAYRRHYGLPPTATKYAQKMYRQQMKRFEK